MRPLSTREPECRTTSSLPHKWQQGTMTTHPSNCSPQKRRASDRVMTAVVQKVLQLTSLPPTIASTAVRFNACLQPLAPPQSTVVCAISGCDSKQMTANHAYFVGWCSGWSRREVGTGGGGDGRGEAGEAATTFCTTAVITRSLAPAFLRLNALVSRHSFPVAHLWWKR